MSPAVKQALPREPKRPKSRRDGGEEEPTNPQTTVVKVSRSSYEPVRQLGEGATASVWSARDTDSGEDVVIKRYHSSLLGDEVARRRIEDEVAIAQRLSHPNIVPVIDSLVTDREAALVFPYVDGQTLAERLKSGGPLAPRDAARATVDIADALSAAHAMGIVHRDVKPSNILLGADGTARLLDFGISRSLEEAGQDRELTGMGMAIGTLPYMAPEQLRAKPPTAATDVFALGIVLYEMLSGHRPFAAESPIELAEHQSVPPARITDAPPALVDLAMAAMAVEPLSRPTAAQFARSASAWLDGRVDAGALTQSVAVVPASVRNRPPVVAAIGIGCLALVASALALTPDWLGPSDPRGAPVAPAATAMPALTGPSTPYPLVSPFDGQAADDGGNNGRGNNKRDGRRNRGGGGDDD